MRFSSIAAAALLSACAVTPEQQARIETNDAAGVLSADGQTFGDGARIAGAAQSCVPLTQIRQSQVRGDRVIDFEGLGGDHYRVVLPHRCPGLGFEQRFSYATSLSQLCSQDIITVLQGGGSGLNRGASCGLAPFQPITPAPRR